MATRRKAAVKAAAPRRTNTTAKKTASRTPTKTAKTAPGRTAKQAPSKKTAAKKSTGKYLGKGTPYKAQKKAGPKLPYYAGKKPAKKTATKQPNKFPSIQDYLMGDTYYQSGLSDLEWALEQFLTENSTAESDVGASFDSAMGYMNLDKEKAHKFMKDDFGARGLNFSGLYPEAVSDYNKEWSMGAADLNRDLASQMRDLGFEEQNMRQSTEMGKKDLRLDAIRRRAEEAQQNQFNNAAGYKGKGAKKTTAKKSAKKAPSKKTAQKKTGTRKTGVRKLRKY